MDRPGGLGSLSEIARDCLRCPLSASRSVVVFGEGDPSAALMIVGEAPGAAEDRAGRPFVGPAGRVVEGLLATIGLARSDVYITNTVMCRPAHNRTPTPDEVGACAPYLDLQLRLVQPRVILALGATAARRLVGGSGRLADLRGRALPIDGATVVATYHPSGLNRDPERRRLIASDFQLARRLIDEGRAESLP